MSESVGYFLLALVCALLAWDTRPMWGLFGLPTIIFSVLGLATLIRDLRRE